MKVSVILLTYNRAELLRKRSLPSVLGQTFSDLECVIVDDHSTDDTQEVVKEFQNKDNRVKYFRLPVHSGIGVVRNFGIDNAKGEFVVFLDDDDSFKPEFLEKTVQELGSLPSEFGAVATGRIMLTKHHQYYLVPSLGKSFYAALGDGWLIRKEVFSKIRHDGNLYSNVDADFGIQFFQLYKAKFIEEPLMMIDRVRRSGGLTYSSYSIPSSAKNLGSFEIFFNKNLPILKSVGTREDVEFIYRFTGTNYCLTGEMRRGIPLLWKACAVKPGIKNILNLAAALLGHKAYLVYWELWERLAHFLKAHSIR